MIKCGKKYSRLYSHLILYFHYKISDSCGILVRNVDYFSLHNSTAAAAARTFSNQNLLIQYNPH